VREERLESDCRATWRSPNEPDTYAARLLESLRWRQAVRIETPPTPAEAVWAECGAMALTGPAEAAPVARPAHVATRARATVDAFRAVAAAMPCDRRASSHAPALCEVDGAALLGERAAIAGLHRRGTTSAGGSCRLVRTSDGWIAVNLAREEDRDSIAAWLETDLRRPSWSEACAAIVTKRTRDLVDRARLMGLPISAVATTSDGAPRPWYSQRAVGPRRHGCSVRESPRVVDLSSLWAGPLCCHLLGLAGADVIKVESLRRPDGARDGPRAFFDLLNADKKSVSLDLASQEGRGALVRLLQSADVVVESARPRALAQMGIDVVQLVETTPGLVWISITGYGRDEPQGGWVAFGDDAAAAAGACAMAGSLQAPVFCADALADPLAGMHAALVAMASRLDGRARLIDVSLVDVTGHVLAAGTDAVRAGAVTVRARSDGGTGTGREWEVRGAGWRQRVRSPRARATAGRAPSLGSDTLDVLGALAGPAAT